MIATWRSSSSLSDGDGSGARQEVYVVVVRASWWKSLRLLEDSGVVLEKPVEHGSLGVGGRNRRGSPRRTQARGRAPHDLAPVALEDECPGVKALGDGTQRA
jgi:hypothetical protein